MNQLNKTKKAFSMLTSIIVIILMATVALFVMNLSGKIVKSTVTQYRHEQAELYAKSYTEYAILAVTGNNRANACVEDINGYIPIDASSSVSVSNGNGYRVRTRIAYIVNGTEVDISNCSTTRVLSNTVVTSDTPLTIIIDAYVDYKDPENTGGPWVTVHRRTVQKI
jgi:type II secretory pathway pseudopilin PulG